MRALSIIWHPNLILIMYIILNLQLIAGEFLFLPFYYYLFSYLLSLEFGQLRDLLDIYSLFVLLKLMLER